jgi:hypothetical protein
MKIFMAKKICRTNNFNHLYIRNNTMAIRKNKKRIDPRYFLHETTYRDAKTMIEEMGGSSKGITDTDVAKAEEIVPKLKQSPEIMDAVKQAAQDPKVQAAVQQALSQGGSMQEEEDPYAGDPIGGAYKKRADLQGIGSAAAGTVSVAAFAAAMTPGALATIGMAAAMTPAMLAMGLVGGPILAGVALMIAAELSMSKHANLNKAADKSGRTRDRSDFSDKEWRKIHNRG